MSLNPAQLEAAIWAGDPAPVRELLRVASEADRRSAAKAIKTLLDGRVEFQVTETFTLTRSSGPASPALLAQFARREQAIRDEQALRFNPARAAARLGLAGGLREARVIADDTPPWPSADATPVAQLMGLPADTLDAIAGVLADRRPAWLGPWAEGLLTARFRQGLPAWSLTRALVRLGAISRPDVPQYTTGMVESLYAAHWHDGKWEVLRHPLDGLLADPGLLEDEVWRLFDVPDAASLLGGRLSPRANASLAQRAGTWVSALATLCEQGRLDRDRLLDACLDAFFKDFTPSHVGWYATLHDRLAPTVGETHARLGKYLALLATNASGVPVAQHACGRLLAAGMLPVADFLAASPAALLSPRKAIAIAQLRLIGQVAREPSVRAPALATAAEAFNHERLDVQEAALDLIGTLGGPDGPEGAVIATHAQRLAPVLISKATGLGMRVSPPARAFVAPAEVAMAPASGTDTRLSPLEDPAELVRLLTQLMEDADDPLAVERALGGAVRLATMPLPDRERAGSPLVKRAEQFVVGRTSGGHALSREIARLALAWTGTPGPPAVMAVSFARILHARIREASDLITAGTAGAQLLAEPSAADGSVHPDAVLARLATWRDEPLQRYDMEGTLLRLPPVDGSFWAAWQRLHPESAAAARQTYHDGTAQLTFDPVTGSASSDNSSRLGHTRILARMTSPPPAAATKRSFCWGMLTDLQNPLDDFERVHGQRWETGARLSPVVASWPLLCPWQPELAAAHLLRPLTECLVLQSSHAGPAAAAVAGLTRSSAPLGPVGHLALLTGLASPEAHVRITAADTWAQAALAGRLDPGLAADALVAGVTNQGLTLTRRAIDLLTAAERIRTRRRDAGLPEDALSKSVTGEAFKLTRVADGLRHASREPTARLLITQSVFTAADRLARAKPPNLHLLLELAAEIGAAIPLPDLPESIVTLATGTGTTKLAVSARRLQDLAGTGSGAQGTRSPEP